MGAVKRSGLGFAVAAGLAILLLGAGTASAHDDIASSDPASGSLVDEPISEVTIDFGEGVESPEMAMFGPDDEIVESVIVQVDDTTARIEFDELEDEGIYIVRYLAPVTADGHTMAGAIQFTYGSTGGGRNVVPILLFCGVAIIALSIGAYFSWRRYKELSADEQEYAHTA